ncbi:MAG TPA: hypothetical protein VLR90_08565 [Blastocatellia bacterium]|nr:hypothetical protein [Blastocatellia bacterium]
MSSTSTAIRLSSYQKLDFGDFKDYIVDDSVFLNSIITRAIQDTELVIYALAMHKQVDTADEALTLEAIYIYGHVQTRVFIDFPEDAIVTPEEIRSYSKSSVNYSAEATALLSKFVNFYIFSVLQAAAKQASEAGTTTITQEHFFSWCHHLPYPLNVYLC